jgi:hypothetical protein
MNKEQVGGDHYKDMEIEPWEYAEANKLSFLQGNIVKYVSRYKSKGGLQDLKKARHCIDLLASIYSPDPDHPDFI